MNIASIDIGTNTVLLLIAEIELSTKTIKTVRNEFQIPRIGKGLQPGNPIGDGKVKELINILTEYKKLSLEYHCEKILLTATNAFRIASNGFEIVNIVNKELGLDINIISGDDEARYSFLGAAGDNPQNKNTVVIDIGGGSTELVAGNSDSIFYKKSFQMGVVSGMENYLFHAPPSIEQLSKFSHAVNKTFAELTELNFNIEKAVAIAGTPTTIACIKLGLDVFDEEEIEGSFLKFNELENLVKELKTLSIHDILLNFKPVVTGREDVLLSGSCILLNLMKLLKLPEVIVSTKGLRYGAIINYLNSQI